ncbi:MAG TPA: 6-phosphogluconolactonase [Tepidisphaeraceae bacterium]|nr:6-phosphogluconolactonase [Tepidisphaeraceae bacterium]
MNTGPHDVRVLPDPPAVAAAAAGEIVNAALEAISLRKQFSIVLSGGSTPKLLYQLLTAEPYVSQIEWGKWEFYFGDERGVPQDHADSNFRMATEELLSKVPVDKRNVHRMQGERPAEEAAQDYGRLLKKHFGDVRPGAGPDVTLLGMGDDGHTLSLFPHTPATKEPRHRCVGQFVENSTTGPSWRITMTAAFVNSSRLVLPLITGAGKAARLKEVLTGPHDPERLPIQLIKPAAPGRTVWLVDQAAAAQL